MTINRTFPRIFSRYTPLLDGRAPVLEATKILTAPQVSAVIVSDKSSAKKGAQYKALTGYNILLKFPGRKGSFSKFLSYPCAVLAQPIQIVSEIESLKTAVKTMRESRVGVVLVSRVKDSSQTLATLELRDFVRLYRDERNLPNTNLKIGGLASSPVLSVKSGATLEDLINAMLKNRVRKIFLSQTKSVISDRDILSYMTSPGIFEQMNESPESVLAAKVSELPSTRPPFVDSALNITEAIQFMSPDSGDCLICDRGLVTLWDLVIKLEESRKGSKFLLRELDQFSRADISSREQRQAFEHFGAKIKLSESQKKRITAVSAKMKVQGFIVSNQVPYFAKKRLVDPLYFNHPARLFQIRGVISAAHKGATKYSSIDLFGRRKLGESYYVLNWEKFSKFIGQKLEVMFRATNPAPSKNMKTAFTRFMHNFGLHWTGCNHQG
ncbi:MAG: hypothetical protein ACYCPW_01455 [Nitrososphaerales archaeon]